MQKSDWKKCKLKDLVKINSSSVSKKDNLEHIVYLDTGNITMGKIEELAEFAYSEAPSRAKRKVKENSIVYSMVRPNQRHYGLIKNPTTNLIVSTGFAVLDAKEFADSKYIYYWLTQNHITDLLQSIAENSTSAYPAIRPIDLENLDISLPPLDEQKRIAEILGSLDDKIELLQKQNKTLEDMAKALFKSWFVDFDVVRAKQKGLPKADIMREYHLTDELYDLFPSSFADSPLGPIPSGWEVKPLSKIATFLNGLALQKYPARAEEDFLPVIKIAELRNGISTSTDKANTNLPTEYIVHNGDILFSWSGSLMVKVWSGEKGALNQHLFKVFSNGYPKWFYYLWVNHYLPMFQEIAADKATTMGHIQRKHLDQANVVCPSAAFLDKMDKIFGVILSKIILNNKQIQTLTELRDTLLPRLISGRFSMTRR